MQKITFKARSKTDFDCYMQPFPASQAIPNWLKEMTPYEKSADNPDGKKLIVRDTLSNASAKKCTPMLDAITSGYIIPLTCDVQVTQVPDGVPLITWRSKLPIFDIHGPSAHKIGAPPGYTPYVFKYSNTWIPQTPPGYSVLVTAPFGHRGLPFHAVPAIIDSDKSTLEVLFPVWVKEGFEGIVEAGTPIAQITPFKRNNWKSEVTYYEDHEYAKVEEREFNRTIVNHYKKFKWSKKLYK